MSNNKIYIIILNWNGYKDTIECIDSIKKINNANFKIVLIDNGSKNNEGEKIKNLYPKIKVIQNTKNDGFCRGNNIGIYYSLKQNDCGYIMILNNDTVVEKNFLIKLKKYLDNNPNSVVGPKILNYNKNTIQTMGGKILIGGAYHIGKNKKSNKYLKPISPDYISGTCFMVKKEIFKKIGGFDEDYFAYLEDLDWSIRAKQRGYNLKIIPESKIWHKHSVSTREGNGWGSFKFYLLAKNSIYFANKNYSGIKKLLWLLFYLLLVSNLHLLLFCRNPKSLISHYKGIIHGLKIYGKKF